MRRRWPVLLYRIAGTGAMLLGAAAVLAWLTGRVASDRYPWSQWLAWIPTPALLPPLLLGFLGALATAAPPRFRQRRVRGWLVLTAAVAAYFALGENRLLRPAPDAAGALSFVHWNMTYFRAAEDQEAHIAPLLGVLGDVTVLIDAYGLRTNERLLAALPDGMRVGYVDRLTVFSRLPILEARLVVHNKHAEIYLLRIDARPLFERPLTAYVIDLPSDPSLSRAAVARHVRAMLADLPLPPPDVVVGDFNIPRGSVSLRRMFPALRDAWNEGGHGYGASFHRRFPLYHIDHVLLAPSVRCPRYDLLDPGVGRHLVQRAFLR